MNARRISAPQLPVSSPVKVAACAAMSVLITLFTASVIGHATTSNAGAHAQAAALTIVSP